LTPSAVSVGGVINFGTRLRAPSDQRQMHIFLNWRRFFLNGAADLAKN
jgi:hypothetical protein